MALKSYKVSPATPPEDAEPMKRHRNLKLADLERRTKFRKKTRKAAKPGKPAIKIIGGGLQSIGRGLTKLSQRMPSTNSINKTIWR